MAWCLVLALAAGGLALSAVNFGQPITLLYALGLVLGTLYSVPPFRLKRYAVTAFLIIATVRGFLLNFGVFTATRAALGAPFVWSPAIMCAYSATARPYVCAAWGPNASSYPSAADQFRDCPVKPCCPALVKM